ncbi:MAG: hypothetical protein IJ087_05000 [Eggerthellaceae bacterium]|nr:hypothetical protein [Eggerthellaceae bacterium]
MKSDEIVPRAIFGMSITLMDDPMRAKLPRVLLDQFDVKLAVLETGNDLRFHALITATRPSMGAVKAAVKAVAEFDRLPCVVCCPAMDLRQKEALSRLGIPYIQNAGNAFLPFIGGIISEGWTARQPRQLSQQAQRIFVNYFAGNWVHCNANQLAKDMGVSNSSVSNYLAELMAIYPSIVTRERKSKYLRPPTLPKAELLEIFEPYFISPVKRVHRLLCEIPVDTLKSCGAKLAGESELAFLSDLGHPEVLTVALSGEGLERLRADASVEWEEAPWYSEAALVIQEWAGPIDRDFPQVHGKKTPSGLPPEWLYVSLVTKKMPDDLRFVDAVDQLRESICR